MLSRQGRNIQSTIEVFEEMQIKGMTFAALIRLLESRRDFEGLHKAGSGDTRLVFMLSDAFDLYNVD